MSSEDESIGSKSPEKGGDILIEADNMNDFFFMDSEQEMKLYGASTKA